jgi:predicted kinase
MAETMQNTRWHGEGDVFTHTKLVCECLIRLDIWRALDRNRQQIVFLAALLHDIGKIVCTRKENGVWTSPHHTSAGERMARALLWRDFGLCGTPSAQQTRETICALIRNHAKILHFSEERDTEYAAIRLAAHGGLVSEFTNELLGILVEADMSGRIADDASHMPEQLGFFREIAEEAGCLKGPRDFPTAFSRYAYLSGRNILPGQELYNDTWGTVVMMAGLPGTGKDTHIEKRYPDLPVVSLDALRKAMGISPKEPQGRIVHAAQEQAKCYLRQKQPFVWNATSLIPSLRAKQLRLFMDYKAMVKIVFLETGWDEMLRRNRNREAFVPEAAIESMLSKLVPPDLSEAHEVEWVLT